MKKNLNGKIIIVTGCEGLLGKEFTKYLCEQNAIVVGIDKKKSNFKNELFYFIQCDITSKTSVKNCLKKIKKNIGNPYGLLHCAAYNPKINVKEDNSIENYSLDKLDKSFKVNVHGTLLVCQIFGSYMAKNKKGSIIILNSIYGLVSPKHKIYETKEKKYFKPIDYSITKSALINLTRYLSTYWGKENIRVNSISLGGIYDNQNKSFIKKYSNNVPLGRLANKNEFNGAIYYLLSDESSYITGSNIVIDGGWTAW